MIDRIHGTRLQPFVINPAADIDGLHNVLLNGGNDRAVVEAGRALKVQEERAEIHVDRTDHRRIIVGHDGFRVQKAGRYS